MEYVLRKMVLSNILSFEWGWDGTFATKDIKQIYVRYFFIKEEIVQKELYLHYCLTEEMWANTLTKPKQNKLLKILKSFAES